MAQSEVEIVKARQSSTRTAVLCAAAAAYHAYIEPLGYQDATPAALSAAVAAALHTLAQCWRDDATWTTEQRKKGHVSTAEQLRQAAARVAGVAVELSAIPQSPPPLAPIANVTTVIEPDVIGKVCGVADVIGDACIRPPHGHPSSHIDGNGNRWPTAIAESPPPFREIASVITFEFLDPDIPVEGPEGDIERFTAPTSGTYAIDSANGVTFIDPPIPFMPGPRLSIREISGEIDLAARPDHRSVSQIATFAECGLKYRLSRYHPDVTRMPSWSTVGGTALHTAIAAEELPDMESVDWPTALESTIKDVESDSGVPSHAWRAANRGKEGYDWWRVEGADMLARYIEWSRSPIGIGTIHDGMVEYETTVDIAGAPVKVIIDQVRALPHNEPAVLPPLHIVDIKSGARSVTDFFQLAVYGYALGATGSMLGSYWNARTGELSTIDIWEQFTVDEIAYRVATMDRAERAGLYVASPSSFCVSCSVGHACPINPRR